jgi:transcriptional regulator with XRE-family HTH domain
MADIRTLRTARGLKLSQLSVLADISYPYLSSVERGIQPLTPQLASRISRVLQVPADDLVAAHTELRGRLRHELSGVHRG